MSYKDRAQKLIRDTAREEINNAMGLVANRISNKTNMGKVIGTSSVDVSLGTINNEAFLDVMMADGTIVKNCQVSGNRPVGIGTTVVNINGILW